MGKLITSTLVLVLAAMVMLVGLLAISVVLGWMEWDKVWDISGKAALVSLIVLLIVGAIGGLMTLLPKSDANQKGKGKR